ncbi:Rhs family protein [Salmonella enterica subsp. enterica]|nr:Rhs family protein [Salmonella enterica subsp. enterica]
MGFCEWTLKHLYYGSGHLQQINLDREVISELVRDHLHREVLRSQGKLDTRRQYDAAANLLDRRSGEAGTGRSNVIPFNRITSYRGLHYRYDGHGRTVEKQTRSGTQRYRYDAEHRMVEVSLSRGGAEERYGYVYDALGRRTEKHRLDKQGKPYNRTMFLWDGMRLAQEFRPEGSSSLYIYSDQGSYEPLARVDKSGPDEPGVVLYYHTDVNGAPEEMTDGRGNIVWEAGYQVWGNLTHEKETRPVQQNLRFQGQYLDRETGLHYNLYRFYDPDIGKFISGDPISLKGGINLYAYAPNPLSWIDPLGLKCGSSYEQARNKALKWLEERGFKAERVNIGKFGSTRGKPVGMTTADGKTGFRIEYDERSGAHINVFSGKDKGEHFLFDASESIVTKLQKLFDLPSKPQRPIS